MSKAKKELTDKQRRFVEEYPFDFNGTQAAKRAGYKGKPKTLSAIARENLEKPLIREALAAFKAKCTKGAGSSVEFVIAGLMENFERAMQHTPVLDHEGAPTGEYQYQGNVANRSLELLGKYHGMFEDRVHVTGEVSFDVKPAPSNEERERRMAAVDGNGSGNGKGEMPTNRSVRGFGEHER